MTDRKLRIGDIVQFHTGPDGKRSNGASVHPAIICRVWSQDCLNLRVLYDGNDVGWETSVGPAEIRDGEISWGFTVD